MSVDGSNPRRLTNHPDWDGWPSWGRVQMPTGIKNRWGELSKDFQVHQNYPNPFNPITQIEFDLPGALKIELEVFNIRGERIKTLVDEMKVPGSNSVTWDGTDTMGQRVSSGLYFYRLTGGVFSQTQKAIVLN